MHNAQCPMHNAHVKLQSCMERISVDEFGLQACSLRLLPPCRFRLQCASLSLSYHVFHRDWLHGWLQILVITGQIAKMSWSGLRYPAIYCQRRIITFWIGAECFRNARKLSLFCSRAGLSPNLDAAWWKKGWGEYRCVSGNAKKGKRWIWLQIRKHRVPSYRRVYAGG